MGTISLVDEALRHVTNRQLQKAHAESEKKEKATTKRAYHGDEIEVDKYGDTTQKGERRQLKLLNRASRLEGARDEVAGEMRKRVRHALKKVDPKKEREHVTNTPAQHHRLTKADPEGRREIKVKKKSLPSRQAVTLKKGKGYTVK